MKSIAIGGLAAIALVVLATGPAGAQERSFTAQLLPARSGLSPDSPGRGTATFRLSADGARLEFEVDAFDIDDVTQIHIHIGEPTTTTDGKHFHRPQNGKGGPIAVFLQGYVLDGVPASGTMAKGVITAADLRGPVKDLPLGTLVKRMDEGAAYVNLHVTKSLGPGCCATGLSGTIRAANGSDAKVNSGAAQMLAPAPSARHPS